MEMVCYVESFELDAIETFAYESVVFNSSETFITEFVLFNEMELNFDKMI